MQLSLVHPDSAPLPKSDSCSLDIPVLRRYNRYYSEEKEQKDDLNIFYINRPQIKKHTNIDEIYLLYKICYNSLSIKDFKFLIKYCNDLQKEIYCNQTILLSGPKSKHIYDFINYNLKDANYTLPILIIDDRCNPEYFGNAVHLISN